MSFFFHDLLRAFSLTAGGAPYCESSKLWISKNKMHGTCTLTRPKTIKGIFSDSSNIFLWHESEDMKKTSLFPKFQMIPILRFQVMHSYVCFIAPIDHCVK